MKTNQPKWKFVAQIGDRNPTEYGGLWVVRDSTGVYPPEGEKLISPDSDSGGGWTVYRFILERCVVTDGIMSANKFHPHSPEWFADSIDSVEQSMGMEPGELTALLCSSDPVDLARGYEAIGDFHGWENLDGYPLTFSKVGDVKKRYRLARYNRPKNRD